MKMVKRGDERSEDVCVCGGVCLCVCVYEQSEGETRGKQRE